MNKESLNTWGRKLAGVLEKYKFVFLILLAGVVLLMLPSFGGGAEEDEAAPPSQGMFDLESTEHRMEEVLSRIEGAGRVRVVLTVRSGARQILAQDGKTTEEGDSMDSQVSTVVISRGSGSEETVALQEIAPQYQGALVVCPGGGDPAVRLQISEAVSALTGLGADRITICKGG